MSSDVYEATLSAYQEGFQVRHIATYNLATCSRQEKAVEVLERYPEFDQIPVKQEDRIVGILEREARSGQEKVGDCMRQLDDSMLVESGEALIDFIQLMAKEPYYRLVLMGTSIKGIITRSDLLKLPIRLLGFALVTHLEMTMKEIILDAFPKDEDWIQLLSKGRRDKLNDKRNMYAERRIDPPLVELTEFCDKRDILKKKLRLSKSFIDDLEEIEKLRNLLAHAGTYAGDEAELQEFIQNLEKTKRWIDDLNMILPTKEND